MPLLEERRDPVIEARQLLDTARAWVRRYARAVADDLSTTDVDAIVDRLGRIGFAEACDAIDALARQQGSSCRPSPYERR